MHRFIGFIPRLVGLLFLFAAINKLAFPIQAISALEVLGIPYFWGDLMVLAVIVIELYLGVVLLWHLDLRWGLAASMTLMFLFAVFLCYLSTLASPPSCGCLGLNKVFSNAKHEAWFGLLRNCLILGALKFSYDHYVGRPATPTVEGQAPAMPAQTA
jgi:hypothetical protein